VSDLTPDEAELLLAGGRAAEALFAAEIGLARRPGDARLQALHQRAMTALSAMDPRFAALQLDAVVNGERPSTHLELGHAYVLLEAWADAGRCFARAAALDPGSAEIQASLGLVALNLGQDEAAERHSRQALAIDEAEVVASQTLAHLLEARGEHEAARRQLDRAYARQALFDLAVPDAALRVLVLATVGAGNVPYKAIMPPARYSRLVWYMEHARPEETPDPERYDLVFNTIGDADLAEPSLAAVEAFVGACLKPVLNRPGPVMRTRRDRLGELLGGLEDVVVPRTVRLGEAEIAARGLRALAEAHGFDGPVIVRPVGLHGGQGMVLVDDRETLDGVRPEAGDHYMIQYLDYRSADGLFRKYRMLFVGGRPFAYHQAISEHWLVHHDTAGMDGRAERQAEEARFLADPGAVLGERGLAAITVVGQALGLDYCGADFALLPDGRILVFEANATMLAHFEDREGPYAYKNAYVAAIAEAFQALLQARAG
jgi:Flp pilus assembly protein TadD/glutathione synthase/RimK-type ligase-like ATP-grasp enzyme